MQSLLTIGYEGSSTDAFDDALIRHRVDVLVDVRAVAASRRQGFAKRALSTRLQELGIRYIHLRDLGDPKPGREAARAGRWMEFRAIFATHLRTAKAANDLITLTDLVRKHRVVLLCYEADPQTCHRSMVAAAVAKLCELAIGHLEPTQGPFASRERHREIHNLGEGSAAP